MKDSIEQLRGLKDSIEGKRGNELMERIEGCEGVN